MLIAISCIALRSVYCVQYNFSSEPIDVVIPCIQKDQRTLDLAIAGIKENGKNIRKIYIISPQQLSDKAMWIDEKIFPFTKTDIALVMFKGDKKQADNYIHNKKTRIGWIYQQLIKLYAPLIIPGISQNVLMLDADTIFMNPVEFQAPDGAALFNPGTEYHKPYFEQAERVVPGFKKIFRGYSGIAHHMLFQRPILVDLLQAIRKACGNLEPWVALVQNISERDFFESGLSEYELYFNFAFQQTDQVKLRFLKWKNSPSLKKWKKDKACGYHYVAYHVYTTNSGQY